MAEYAIFKGWETDKGVAYFHGKIIGDGTNNPPVEGADGNYPATVTGSGTAGEYRFQLPGTGPWDIISAHATVDAAADLKAQVHIDWNGADTGEATGIIEVRVRDGVTDAPHELAGGQNCFFTFVVRSSLAGL